MQLRFFDKYLRDQQITIIDCLLICFSFSLAISTALSSIFFILTLCSIPFKNNYIKKLKETFKLPIVKILLCFVAWVVIGLAYNPAPVAALGAPLKQALRPLAIVFMVPLITEKNYKWIIITFIASMFLTSILAITQQIPGLYFEIKPGYSAGAIFKNHITTSFLTAIACFFMVHLTFSQPSYRLFKSIIISFLCFHILFLNAGRTGYIIFFVLFILFLIQRFKCNGRSIGLIVLAILTIFSFQLSPHIRERTELINKDFTSFSKGNTNTSVGLRLEFLKNSFTLFQEKPIIGWGTGNFTGAYKTIPTEKKVIDSANPHNQYALIAVENGSIGLILLCVFLLYSFWISLSLFNEANYTFQGILVAFIVGSIGNSLLLDHTEGLFFVLFTALSLSLLLNFPTKQSMSS